MIVPNNIMTRQLLLANPEWVFVFGDNTIRKGKGGAAKLRDMPNAYGFITKKFPNNADKSFYREGEYVPVFEREMRKLVDQIESNPNKFFFVSKLGGGLASKYGIWKKIIKQGLVDRLSKYDNVVFMFNV